MAAEVLAKYNGDVDEDNKDDIDDGSNGGVKVALVFGNERFGMTGEEVDACSHTVNIQTDAPMQVRPALRNSDPKKK